MAYLPEQPEWTDGVYQLEKSDPVRGGVDGPANRPLIDLLKRTAWLKQRYEEAFSGLGWAELGEWAVGLEVTTPSQIVHYQGYWYRYGGSLPHTITGDSPSLDDNDNWFNLGNDVSLRANLGSGEAGLGLGIVNTVYGEMADRILKRIYGFNVCAHGARSIGEDGYEDFDSRVAIQSAIDAAHAAWLATGSVQNVFFPSGSKFLVSSAPAVMESGVTSGLWCLRIRSGVRLAGGGTIKPVDNAFAADTTLFRVIGSDSGGATRPTDVHFEGITLDGNLENQVANSNAHGIWVYTLGNSDITRCDFQNIAGCGGSLRGMMETPAKNIKVIGNQVANCGNIGLQVSWFDGLVVDDNIVRDCTDNGIDLYGDSGKSGRPTGINFSAFGNTVTGCLTGIFLETVADGSVFGNNLEDNTQNIQVNRITSQPRNIVINGNTLEGGVYSIRVQGDMRAVKITGNTIRGYSNSAFRLGNSSNANVSYVNIRGNTIIPTVATSYVVWIGGGTASRISVKGNTVENSIGLTAEYLYHNQAATNVQVSVGSWEFWAGELPNTGIESYSEGMFSPTVAGGTTGGTGTYTNQYGKYTKMGNIVHFTLSLAWSAHTGVGPILINNLPFAASADNNQTINAAISSVSAGTTSARLFMRNINGSTVAQMIFFDGAAATSYPQVNSTGGSVQVSGFYFAS
ncbi:right-handed parallel beta-helix repeat-containing protein [Klebsiella oxytoca]|uniref:right-handed parallel beta-helix repeat-containing protein n=3 Tax=Klebsiella oxytoca TaxID=571 RepID=UPI0025A1041A|nr:right-handed parallel beta-helix repeat-containing protein [Klebsiella oxytoca]MDM7564980.1 right-handed parallel beta-helix repeat-containing protein [Klebsiella oxytoca]